MDAIQKSLLEQVAELHDVPEGAYNIRANGKAAARNTTAHIDIVSKTDKDGIDIIIKPGTKNESVHIPVVLSESGLTETVYNDFFIGDDCDVTIVAGCGGCRTRSTPGSTPSTWASAPRCATWSATTARATAGGRTS